MLMKECPKCESRAGLNIMKAEVTQLIDVKNNIPQLTDWICGFCGYKENDTTYMGSLGGMQTTVVEGVRGTEPPVEEPPVEEPPVI